MNPHRVTLKVTGRAQRKLKIHKAWWKKNRKDAPKLFNESVRAAYSELRLNSDLGSRYEQDGVSALRFLTETKHWLYYIVQTLPTGKQQVLIIGIQGPGEEVAPL